MSTLSLFRDDAFARDCDATVVSVEPGVVRLDRTVFYPLGGGQAGDQGWLELADGTRLTVLDTRKGATHDDVLHHIDAADAAKLAPGSRVRALIDWDRRLRHMRLHTSTHLLCALLPYPVNGCSITAEGARLDFHTDAPIDRERVNEGLARLVLEARPVAARWITDAELDAQPQLVRSMSVQPPRGTGKVRLLEIEGVDLQPCGGTHVANTCEIGGVRVVKTEKKGAMMRRVLLGFVE
jgi:misacylated tRNA(Ala) deacylase